MLPHILGQSPRRTAREWHLGFLRALTARVASCGEVLTDKEKENLFDSVIVIGMELAGRFLDDYLAGDKYFKTDYPGHNLVRVRSQIALVRDVMAKYDELNAIVKELI